MSGVAVRVAGMARRIDGLFRDEAISLDSTSNTADSRLWRPLALSVLLHAALLASQSPPRPGAAAAAPLSAVILAPEQRPAPRSSVSARPRQEEDSARPSVPRRRAAPPAAPALAQAKATAARALARPAQPGADSDGLRQYRFSLALAARRFATGEQSAGLSGSSALAGVSGVSGLSGRAAVTLRVGADGSAAKPELAESSGQPRLDRAALDLVARAAEETSVPAGLVGAAFVVRLPIEFALQER